jgi:HNH endonuclease/AP2 domain
MERFWSKVDKNGPLHPTLGTRCWLWTASKDGCGYGMFKVADGTHNGHCERAHRYSFQQATGTAPSNLEVDHRCHVKSCVRPGHLRLATDSQQKQNLSGVYRNNTSGVRGVCWCKRERHWLAQVRHEGRRFHVGYFDTIAEAEAAVLSKRLELFTHNDLDRAACQS